MQKKYRDYEIIIIRKKIKNIYIRIKDKNIIFLIVLIKK